MEPGLTDRQLWKGTVGMALAQQPRVDFSDPRIWEVEHTDQFNGKIDELCR